MPIGTRIVTLGRQANKVMHLSAIAYNLKKYLKFIEKRSKSGAGQLALTTLVKSAFQYLFGTSTSIENWCFSSEWIRKKPLGEAYFDDIMSD
ncbi:hypothetical protein HPE56_20065 [Maribacter sp. ANRC-HE7]|uniref:Transposase DDE domain-containing protein n=1 Tax=Maribacter aquimaris TaxID=2737171 RepID=A0ABR7V611_9FLAO|nr:hypothetical protein [Maribacter aquimaris]MBD0780098.1 hypothetical protein [Maribacter aquimaris]MBD0780101.1 hypothetical protein [Maribacter aquimaris]